MFISKGVSALVVFALLVMTVPLAQNAEATGFAQDFSVALSTPTTGSDDNVIVTFTLTQAIANAGTFTLDFPTSGSSTSDATSFGVDTSLGENDVDIGTSTDANLTTASDCSSTEKVGVAVNTSTGAFVFTLCSGDGASLASGDTVTIKIGTNATVSGTGSQDLNNPTAAGSFTVTLDSGSFDTYSALAVIMVDTLTVTATVPPSFSITFTGVASGQTGANGEGTNTTVQTTTSTIPWGTLTAGTARVARHNIAVNTNAGNGFSVKVIKSADLTNTNGDTINIFTDGTDGSPAAWASPASTVGSPNTYGHMGITSSDSTLGSSCGSDTFGSALYDAVPTYTSAPTSGIEVMCNTGPAAGATDGIGSVGVGYKIQVGALQEAGTYSNFMIYKAIPSF